MENQKEHIAFEQVIEHGCGTYINKGDNESNGKKKFKNTKREQTSESNIYRIGIGCYSHKKKVITRPSTKVLW